MGTIRQQPVLNTIIGVPFENGHHLRAMCAELPEVAGVRELARKQGLFKIRLADDAGRRSSAGLLINQMYSWRGYSIGTPTDTGPNRITLVAGFEEATIGTVSINFDSKIGLLVDQLYKDEVDKLRAAGHRVCEFGRFAVDGKVKSKRVLAALFHIAMIVAFHVRKASYLLIEVNPRHVKFYERMLDMRQIGGERLNTRVNAPAVLLGVDFAYGEVLAQRFGGRPELSSTEKSFYPYFFSPAEAEGIARRLQLMNSHG